MRIIPAKRGLNVLSTSLSGCFSSPVMRDSADPFLLAVRNPFRSTGACQIRRFVILPVSSVKLPSLSATPGENRGHREVPDRTNPCQPCQPPRSARSHGIGGYADIGDTTMATLCATANQHPELPRDHRIELALANAVVDGICTDARTPTPGRARRQGDRVTP